MDIQMPVMDGIEAASKITALTGTPIVAMTANIMSHEREIYAKSGMTDYLGKPFTSAELVRCLLKYLKPAGTEAAAGIGQAGDPDEVDIRLKKRFESNFLNNGPLAYREIREAVNAGDKEKAYRLAHTLAGNAALIDRAKLRHIASSIEKLLKDGVVPPEEHFTLLKDELDAVIKEITKNQEQPAGTKEQKTTGNEEAPDPQRARSLLDNLETMLKERNPQCITLLDDIRAIAGTEDIIRDVENFDFKPAINKIRKKREEITANEGAGSGE
jgi:CheY-like chemotaxis protein